MHLEEHNRCFMRFLASKYCLGHVWATAFKETRWAHGARYLVFCRASDLSGERSTADWELQAAAVSVRMKSEGAPLATVPQPPQPTACTYIRRCIRASASELC